MLLNDTISASQRQPVPGARPRKNAKRPSACEFCRLKKVKCNGECPCTNCIDRNRTCVMATRLRTRRKAVSRYDEAVTDRIARVEALIQRSQAENSDLVNGNASLTFTSNTSRAQFQRSSPQQNHFHQDAPPLSADNRLRSPRLGTQTHQNQLSYSIMRSPPLTEASGMMAGQTSAADYPSSERGEPCQVNTTTRLPFPTFELNANIPPIDHNTNVDASYRDAHESLITRIHDLQEESSISSNHVSDCEYHGPKSYLSVCSEPGIRWVIEQTAAPHFRDVATTLMADVSRRLKMDKRLSKQRIAEPEPELGWKYIEAYFDNAVDAALGTVRRSWFESKFKAHLTAVSHADEDPGWYALRNIIYASGCRIEISKHKNIREANQAAWGWFENALSVHTEILYFRTSMIGIQALTLMAYFCENIGSPCLEYMLCTNALRLAVSKGFHRQPVASSNLSQEERSQRNLIFWAAYCLEKHIVSQSGRPSIIDDDEINCNIPQTPLQGSSTNIFYCDTLIRLAQLSSLACKKVFSHRAFRKGPKALVNALVNLDEQLRTLKRSKESVLYLDAPVNPKHLPASLSLQQTIYLHYAYYNTVFDIHTVLAIPWAQNMLGLSQDLSLASQIEKSTDIVAKTCRHAILTTTHIHLDASTPVPLTFFGPINALINLFINILKFPDQPRVQSDLALLSICAGHFARLEFATDSEISFPFVMEAAILARDAIKLARSNPTRHRDRSTFTATHDRFSRLNGSRQIDEISSEHSYSAGNKSYQNRDGFTNNLLETELEEWDFMLPIPNFDDNMQGFLNS